MDWIRRISDHSTALANIAEHHPPDTPVPTCPDWNLGDLTWHLSEVQDFWAWIIENRPAGPTEYPEPGRPDVAALPHDLRTATARLVAVLGEADPKEPAWSWAVDQTVAFTLRRQAHESWIHLVDAAIAVDEDLSAVDAEFAVDGIDEFVSNNVAAEIPSWATFEPEDRCIGLVSTGGTDWVLRFGRFLGTSLSGTTYDDDYGQRSQGTPDAVVRADPDVLLRWLWGRADSGDLLIEGDSTLADRLRAIARQGSQ